ncbi:MAG: hypothetical protein OD814_000541 [Candidatus Alkanophagales archaeon MCA70_species_1]|nr:hypothetical protein [Candidatus Alkanophaga volatiphilum]
MRSEGLSSHEEVSILRIKTVFRPEFVGRESSSITPMFSVDLRELTLTKNLIRPGVSTGEEVEFWCGTVTDKQIDKRELELISKHLEEAEKCRRNAEDLMRRDEWVKAGEILWGAVLKKIHALGRLIGIRGTKKEHRLEVLKRVLSEDEVKELYKEGALQLHVNFYTGDIEFKAEELGIDPRELFDEYWNKAQRLFDILNDQIKERVDQSQTALKLVER